MKIFKRRPGAIYEIRTRKSRDTDRTHRGYVGKTRQRVENRVTQHRLVQHWSDLIVSHHVLWSSTRVTAFGLWWREIYYILTRFPVYNYQWNRWNPRRVPVYRARAERGARNGVRHYNGERMWTRS